MKKKIDVAIAFFKFLRAARNRVKEGMGKEQILDFARREFGEVSKLLRKQIDDLFKKKDVAKIEKKGEVVPIKKDEGIMSQYKSIDDDLTPAETDAILDNFLANADRTYANFVTKALRDIQKASKSERQQMIKAIKDRTGMFKYLDDADAEKILKSVDEGIVATDAAKEIVKKRTKDIATGDPTGETSEIMEGLAASIEKIKKSAKELKKTKIDPLEEMIKMQKVQQSMMKGGDMYKQGNIRTAVRQFMQSEVKAGRLKLNEQDAFRVREYSPMTEDDPIDVFRRWYGEDALEEVDRIGNVFEKGESFKHYEQLLRENVDPSVLTIKKTGAGQYDPGVMGPAEERKLMEQVRKDKEQKELLENFDIDPNREPNAYGGIAGTLRLNRTGFRIGSAPKAFKLAKRFRESPEYKKFIEMLFIKTSNMIRQGKGMWKGLTEKQWIKQHDNLTKEVTNFQKTGELPESAHQYFGMNPEVAYAEKLMELETKKKTALENIIDKKFGKGFSQSLKAEDEIQFDKLKAWDPGKGRKPSAEGGLINILKL